MGKNRNKKNNGYTLIEIIVTIIILGVIASLAIPNYVVSVERTKASEGAQMLEALLNGQRRHLIEYNEYATDISQLDVEVKTLTNNFQNPLVFDNPSGLATIDRIGLYTLSIDEDGIINCVENGAPPGTCRKLGY